MVRCGLVWGFLAAGVALYLDAAQECSGNGKLALLFQKVHLSLLFFSFAFFLHNLQQLLFLYNQIGALRCWEGQQNVWHQRYSNILIIGSSVPLTRWQLRACVLIYRSERANRSTRGWRERGGAIPDLQERGTKCTFQRVSPQCAISLWMVTHRTKTRRVKRAFLDFCSFNLPPSPPQAWNAVNSFECHGKYIRGGGRWLWKWPVLSGEGKNLCCCTPEVPFAHISSVTRTEVTLCGELVRAVPVHLPK